MYKRFIRKKGKKGKKGVLEERRKQLKELGAQCRGAFRAPSDNNIIMMNRL